MSGKIDDVAGRIVIITNSTSSASSTATTSSSSGSGGRNQAKMELNYIARVMHGSVSFDPQRLLFPVWRASTLADNATVLVTSETAPSNGGSLPDSTRDAKSASAKDKA